eukprot:570150-Amphidinium_carterae.2
MLPPSDLAPPAVQSPSVQPAALLDRQHLWFSDAVHEVWLHEVWLAMLPQPHCVVTLASPQLQGLNGELPNTDCGNVVISFSHFLPRTELLPEKRYLFYPPLMKARGQCQHKGTFGASACLQGLHHSTT